MKTTIYKSVIVLIFTLANLLVSASLFAQAPQKMSYQVVIRDGGDALVTRPSVGMRVSILKNATPVDVETHIALANANGLVILEIGSGALVLGNIATIDWAAGAYFIKTITDPKGGANHAITRASQLLSMSYALYFKTSRTPGFSGPQGLTGAVGPAGAIGAGTVTNTMLAGNINLMDEATGTLPIENGGTGSATQNFVDLIAHQSIAGDKTFTGTVGGITKAMISLTNVDNTTAEAKRVSTATQTELDTKAVISGQVFTGVVSAMNLRGTNTGDQNIPSFAISTNLALKADIASPTSTGDPLAPTAAVNTNTTQIATIAFVAGAITTADAILQTNLNNLGTAITAAATAIKIELDATQTGAGLNANGTYTANAAVNNIYAATSLVNATEALDNQVRTNADGIAINAIAITNNATTAANAIAAVQSDVDNDEAASIAGDATLQTNINTLQTTSTNTAIAAVQTGVDNNEAATATPLNWWIQVINATIPLLSIASEQKHLTFVII